MKRLKCASNEANKAYEVIVESAFVRALPGFCIVGLPSQSIQESKDRIKSALSSVGFNFPAQKITINLSPSDLRKDGSHFDLPIALLIALQKQECFMDDFFVFGELGLDGSIKSTKNIFALVLSLASKYKNLKVLVPEDIKQAVASIPHVKCYSVKDLKSAIEFFTNLEFQEKCMHTASDEIFQNTLKIEDKEYIVNKTFKLDFSEVIGQSRAKRAALIAAAGMHNILLEGSPGCGKSMIIKRLVYILPPLSVSEVLECAAINSSEELTCNFSSQRPFRSPHHTSSRPSIFGGGSLQAKPGEVALAHLGVLFFDEFPHFSKQVLESLREPLEDKCVLISRVNTKISYQTNFLFAAAQNPCPCGYMLSLVHQCKCNEMEIKRYKSKLSAPLLDRIEIFLQMDENKSDENEYTSQKMQNEVLKAFIRQKKRKQAGFNSNLSTEEISKFCALDTQTRAILDKAMIRYGLSRRSVDKILKLSRTIADLADEESITKEHLLEALSFRQS